MEGAKHRGQRKKPEAVPSGAKKTLEEALKPPINTTITTATKEATKDGVLKPSERTTMETLKREGPKPLESIAAGCGTTDESPSRPPLIAECMYPTFSRFASLKPID